MSLVPYDGSDLSESEDEKEQEISKNNESLQTFSKLPTPKQHSIIVEEENDEFLQKKPVTSIEKKPVKITIPSLIDLNEENSVKKFHTTNSKSTGLFSVLPPPKGSGTATILVPQSVKKSTSIQKPLLIPKKVQDETLESTKKEEIDNDLINDEPEITSDFFSLDKSYETEIDLPETSVPKVNNNIKNSTNVFFQPTYEEPQIYAPNEQSQTLIDNTKLDENALKILVGSRGKRKFEEISTIIDLHEKDIKPDNKKWFQQAQLQGHGPDESTTVTEVPGGILKRKHQITYLAQQAKANEQQLKNQWAQNRATRQQTQSKYGF